MWPCCVRLIFPLARLVFDLAFENIIRVSVITHPSLLKPEDLDVRLPEVLVWCSLTNILAEIYREEQSTSTP